MVDNRAPEMPRNAGSFDLDRDSESGGGPMRVQDPPSLGGFLCSPYVPSGEGGGSRAGERVAWICPVGAPGTLA
jgi:hypothetical protein